MRYLTSLIFAFMALYTSIQATNLTVEVYTTPGCCWCVKAMDILKEQGIRYKEINIHGKPDLRAQLNQRVRDEITGPVTFPRIFINGKHIGGHSDLLEVDFDLLSKQGMASGG